MQQYAVSDVERLLRMPRGAILGLVRAGFVAPARGPRREYLFSFQDLIALRTARALTAANVPPRRIARSLKELRRRLPAAAPLSGLRIRAVGDRVVVEDGNSRWQADSGQLLLELDVSVAQGELNVLSRTPAREQPSADQWFGRGWQLEDTSPQQAAEAYAHALERTPGHAGARINLGRLLHAAGQLGRAERVYREGIEAGIKSALLLFNFGALLDDMGKCDEAIAAYEAALLEDPRFADCHYNLALAYEARGNARGAIRHLNEYRKLSRGAQ